MEYLRELIAEHKRNIPVVADGDGASSVDTDDTNSMGARYRDDTEGV
jgi:hypothetical protein